MSNRNEMIDTLMSNVCRVRFTKTNGEERDMLCTRNFDSIPEHMRPSSNKVVNESVIPVYDLNANGWRSFRVDSVISFEVSL